MKLEAIMKHSKLIFMGILAILLIIIIFQNTETVNTTILFMSIAMPRFILLFLVLLIGFAAGVIVTLTLNRNKSNE
jgi:uncharacterized integral membrane protein